MAFVACKKGETHLPTLSDISNRGTIPSKAGIMTLYITYQ
jgi:hypothetical protein